MPNSSSAKKSLRRSERRRVMNKSKRSALRTSLKRFRAAVESGDKETATQLLPVTQKKLDQAAASGLIHRNKAARGKSSIARAYKAAFDPHEG